ncbi:hypothetical protein CBS101457_002940 [Exobasidium rhododendri]|nr:hypothetical protein CBS101457_002940 [Exobasidium rhododendri]
MTMQMRTPTLLAGLASLLIALLALFSNELGLTRTEEAITSVVAADLPGTASASGAKCRGYYFPVNIGKTPYKLWGQLCTNDVANLGKQPVQILIHGGCYDHMYYDWPYQPERYNYVRNMTREGYTTLAIDRLGYGKSDHPAPTSLNFDVAGENLHQVVKHLRKGSLGYKFDTIVANGYSMGGMTAQVEASRYHDLDAIMIHAVGHHTTHSWQSLFRLLSSLMYPVILDRKFAKDHWHSPGYLTSVPGRRTLFHGPPGSIDPAQFKYEEELRDLVSITELMDIATKSDTNLTKTITKPVLHTFGQYDGMWCIITEDCFTDPRANEEHEYYQPGLFTGYVIPNTGHGALLGYGGEEYIGRILTFLQSHNIHGRP